MELEALSGKISVLEALNGVEMRALETQVEDAAISFIHVYSDWLVLRCFAVNCRSVLSPVVYIFITPSYVHHQYSLLLQVVAFQRHKLQKEFH